MKETLRRMTGGFSSGASKRRSSLRSGVTLTELMVAVTVLTIGVISSMGAFKYINRSMLQSRIKTIATNLAQEQMEVLRNKSYFQLLVTTAPTASSGYTPSFEYDTVNYPPQTITLWGMPPLTRVVYVQYVAASGTTVSPLPYTANDPGMKKITVTVMWANNGSAQKIQLASYYENPTAAMLSSGFSGRVTDASDGMPVQNAQVQVLGSPNWQAYTDAAGNYGFQVAPGSYTLVCSTLPYFSATSPSLSVTAGAYTPYNFSLNQIATGTVSGMAYIRDHLVISQVVGSSLTVDGGNAEWVEVYNPSTWTWIMATSPGFGSNAVVQVGYQESGASLIVPNIDYRTTTLAPGHYYLFANTGTITADGITVQADAVYDTDNNWNDEDDMILTGDPSPAGYVAIGNAATMTLLDLVGWNATNNGSARLAPGYEGMAIQQSIGLEVGESYTRHTSAGALSDAYGRCYDANNNQNDFSDDQTIVHPPHDSSYSAACLTGTPAAGAAATASDGLSSPAQVSSTGYFLLTNVATTTVLNQNNSWTITVASNTVFGSSSAVTVPANANVDLGAIALSSSVTGGIAFGYVYGSGPDQNKPLGSPTITVGAEGITANTNSQGFYMLFLPTGTVTVTANYGNVNGSYQPSDMAVNMPLGQVTQVPDFHLVQGGYLTGYVTSGTGALPNVVVQASNGGPVYQGTSDITGHFYIYAATAAVAYSVSPVLDPLQSYVSAPSTPLYGAVSVPSNTVFCGTITVVGAMGTIQGTLTQGGAAITTGVLVVASTAAVTDPLPAINAASAPSLTAVYSVSSQADGTYSLAVRAGAGAYNVRAFYPVVDPNSGAVTYTSEYATGVSVNAGAITEQDFSW